MAAFKAYPSHRFHPSLGHDGYVEVADKQEDTSLLESDELWRDKPYNEAECAEWKQDNPKGQPARKPAKKKTVTIEVDDDEQEGGKETPAMAASPRRRRGQ